MEKKTDCLTAEDLDLLEHIKTGDHPYFDRQKVEPLMNGGYVRLAEFGRVVITKSGSKILNSAKIPF